MKLQNASIIIPPLILLIVGVGSYIAIEKITAPKVVTLKATGSETTQSTPSATPLQSSASASPTPTATPINTAVPSQSSAQVAALQAKVDGGEDTWRMDPLSTAEKEGENYGFSKDDEFRYDASSPSLQSASSKTLLIAHGGAIYRMVVSQPGTKGAKGVWIIQSIESVTGG